MTALPEQRSRHPARCIKQSSRHNLRNLFSITCQPAEHTDLIPNPAPRTPLALVPFFNSWSGPGSDRPCTGDQVGLEERQEQNPNRFGAGKVAHLHDKRRYNSAHLESSPPQLPPSSTDLPHKGDLGSPLADQSSPLARMRAQLLRESQRAHRNSQLRAPVGCGLSGHHAADKGVFFSKVWKDFDQKTNVKQERSAKTKNK